jgi:hypothetical protein
MPKLTKKEGLFLSRLRDQGGRLAISGNKYDRLIKAGYVLPEHDRSIVKRHTSLRDRGERDERGSTDHDGERLGDSYALAHAEANREGLIC